MLKKLPFLLALAAITVFSSCKKDEEEGGGGGTTLNDNQWKVLDVTYTGSSLIGSAWNEAQKTLGSATDGLTSVASVKFAAKPTANGTYTVKASGDALGATDCFVTIVNAPSTAFFSSGKSGDVVNVTVTGGKVTASFSNVEVLYTSGSTPATTTASAKLVEK